MKVLVIDDEPLVRRSLQRAFTSRGHEVLLAEDGEQGLQVWRECRPDLVLLDVLMPKLTGPQVLRLLGNEKTGRVILMSAYSGEDHFENAESLGAEDFISKPFRDIFEVVDRGEELVEGAKA